MLRRIVAGLAVAAGLIGLGIDAVVVMGLLLPTAPGAAGRNFGDVFVYYWTFLTHLANLGVLLVYLSAGVRWRWFNWFRSPVTQAGMAGIIALVMVFFHVMLAPHFHFSGPILVSNMLLHTVAPLAYLLWWLLGPHGVLRLRDVPLMLVPGLAYVAWVLARGLVVHDYPYTILNPDFALPGQSAQGYFGVAIGVVVILFLVALFDIGLVLIDAWLARRQAQETGA